MTFFSIIPENKLPIIGTGLDNRCKPKVFRYFILFFLIITSSCHDDFLATSRPVSRMYSREEKFRKKKKKFFFPRCFSESSFLFFFVSLKQWISASCRLFKVILNCFDFQGSFLVISLSVAWHFFFLPIFRGLPIVYEWNNP